MASGWYGCKNQFHTKKIQRDIAVEIFEEKTGIQIYRFYWLIYGISVITYKRHFRYHIKTEFLFDYKYQKPVIKTENTAILVDGKIP